MLAEKSLRAPRAATRPAEKEKGKKLKAKARCAGKRGKAKTEKKKRC